MTDKPTKKSLNEALAPLFKAYDRHALGIMGTMPKTPRPQPITWRGLTVDIALVRRPRIVCNVPAPFSAMEFLYEARRDGQKIVAQSGRPNFVDAVFAWHNRNGVEL